MSDGITDMYRAMEESEKNKIFLTLFSQCLLSDKKPKKELVEAAMVSGALSRELLGNFGWMGKEHYKSCKEKLTSCIKKLVDGSKEEWALFIKLYLIEKHSGSQEWNDLLSISPFKGCQVANISRGGGQINIGSAGMGSHLWDIAKKDLGNKWEKWDGYGLLILKIADAQIIPLPKERNSRF